MKWQSVPARAARAFVVGVFVVLFAVGGGQAQSLWGDSGSMFSDRKASEVGDLITIIIVERSQATQSATTTTNKDGSVEVGPIALADLIPVIPPISAGGSDSFGSRGSTTRGGSLNARMTAKVVEQLPNGTLIIEGRQSIIVNEEEQTIVVNGTVRPEDIEPDNTVLSSFIADASISYHGTGPVAEKQVPGLLTRLFNWLF